MPEAWAPVSKKLAREPPLERPVEADAFSLPSEGKLKLSRKAGGGGTPLPFGAPKHMMRLPYNKALKAPKDHQSRTDEGRPQIWSLCMDPAESSHNPTSEHRGNKENKNMGQAIRWLQALPHPFCPSSLLPSRSTSRTSNWKSDRNGVLLTSSGLECIVLPVP